MKTYKEFSQISIGDSDVACLILAGCGEEGVCTSVLNYGEDGEYYAYIVDEPDVEIGSHYSLVAEFSSWMRIYDDDEMTARFFPFYYHVTMNFYGAESTPHKKRRKCIYG